MKNRVLLVGGNEQLFAALKLLFEMNGFLPELAFSASQATGLLDIGNIDYVLLDFTIGAEEGAEVVAHLESMPGALPEVLVAGSKFLGGPLLERAMKLAKRVFLRPFSFDELLAELRQSAN